MSINALKGTFWFPGFESYQFQGVLENDNQIELTMVGDQTFQYKEFFSSILRELSNTINGCLENNQLLTLIIFAGKITIVHLTPERHAYIIKPTIKKIFYDYHFKSLSEVYLKSLVVTYSHAKEWVGSSLNNEPENNGVTINLDKNYLINIIAKKTRDKHMDTNPLFNDISFQIISKEGPKSYLELIDVTNILKSFINFVITKYHIIIDSMVGTIENDSNINKIIKIKDFEDSSNYQYQKLDVVSPVLLPFSKYTGKLEKMFKCWYIFAKSNYTLYHYYIEASYYITSPIDSFFKLISFIEGFHREIWERNTKSPIKHRKKAYFETILDCLNDLEVNSNDWSIVNKILNNNVELTLSQRLKDIFDLYKEIITIHSPIISHFEKPTIENTIRKLEIEDSLSNKLITIVNSKIDGDATRFDEQRKEIHSKIISELNNSPKLQQALLHLIEYLLVEKIANQLSIFRNDVAHFNERYNKIKQTDWKFGIRILELCVQICILNMFGLSQQEIYEVYSAGGYDEDKKIANIISSVAE